MIPCFAKRVKPSSTLEKYLTIVPEPINWELRRWFAVFGRGNKNRSRGLKNKDLVKQFYKERDADSSGFQRVKQLSTDKISMAIFQRF